VDAGTFFLITCQGSFRNSIVDMATSKPRARKQRIRREQVREAQRRRRERLRSQHQRFLQLLVPEDVHQMLSRIATDLDISVQQLALDLIRKALGSPQPIDASDLSAAETVQTSEEPLPPTAEIKPISADKASQRPVLQENGSDENESEEAGDSHPVDDDRQLSLF